MSKPIINNNFKETHPAGGESNKNYTGFQWLLWPPHYSPKFKSIFYYDIFELANYKMLKVEKKFSAKYQYTFILVCELMSALQRLWYECLFLIFDKRSETVPGWFA